MPDSTRHQPEQVLDFWFREVGSRHWFRATPQLDARIRDRFEGVWEAARVGACRHWEVNPRGALALVVVLDQFPLNMYRGEARAFATEPAVLFADEPTGNLDSRTGANIMKLMFDLNRSSSTTLILVTHDNGLAERCDRVLELEGGKLVRDSGASA